MGKRKSICEGKEKKKKLAYFSLTNCHVCFSKIVEWWQFYIIKIIILHGNMSVGVRRNIWIK